VIRFDGQVIETFGFGNDPSQRVHVAFPDVMKVDAEEFSSQELAELLERHPRRGTESEGGLMSTIRVSLANENPAYAGAVSFDGMSLTEKGDSYGVELPVKPSDRERIALQELANAIQGAAGGGA
jgi:hypothetical protein